MVARNDVAYEVVELEATSVDGLLTWLELNGYGLPANSER